MSLAAIIVAAGSSRRMGFDKLLTPLHGVPVLTRSILAFANTSEVEQTIVVCPQDRFSQLDLPEGIIRVDGGDERHHSVSAGLAVLADGITHVAVHDGARPLISAEQIRKVHQAAIAHRCATSARQITETVKRANQDGFIQESVSRENLWLMETPQIFQRDLLENAYQSVLESGTLVTDEVSALELNGHPTLLVTNTAPNPKITFPEDIALAEKILQE
ncbi:MAG: 2-C-methyl-D-erythritol 4-phosphate cytidylyltransferase [Akkermansiaceae bacterium]